MVCLLGCIFPFYYLLTSTIERKESLHRTYTNINNLFIYRHQILLNISLDSSKKWTFQFFFHPIFSEIIQSNLEFFNALLVLDLIRQYVPKNILLYYLFNYINYQYFLRLKTMQKCILLTSILKSLFHYTL